MNNRTRLLIFTGAENLQDIIWNGRIGFKFEILNENKDGNIHKSDALNRYDKRTLTLVECQNEKAEQKCLNKIVSK